MCLLLLWNDLTTALKFHNQLPFLEDIFFRKNAETVRIKFKLKLFTNAEYYSKRNSLYLWRTCLKIIYTAKIRQCFYNSKYGVEALKRESNGLRSRPKSLKVHSTVKVNRFGESSILTVGGGSSGGMNH